jgi:hypothetical protein
MNARGNISAPPRKRHVADVDAPTRGTDHSVADPAHARAGRDSVVRSPGANLGKPEKLWATHFRYLNSA